MSGTQIALIVVGVVLVGIAVFVGATHFRENPALANESALSWDASLIVAEAERWYKQSPGRSFEGLTLGMLGASASNDNGTFEIQNAGDKGFQLLATGTEDGDGDGKPLQMRLTYNALTDTTTWERLGQ